MSRCGAPGGSCHPLSTTPPPASEHPDRNMAADNPRSFRCGERWWPEGESDAAALRGRGWYALYVAAIVACAATLLLRAPPPCTATLAAAATSDVVAPWALLLFRGAACALVVGTLVSLGRQDLTVTLETVDRRDVVLVSSGLWRLQVALGP